MKSIVLFLLLLFATTEAFPQRIGVGIGLGKRKPVQKTQSIPQYPTAYPGTEYYVSSTGNDSNNGTSPQTAWKTLAKVNVQSLSPGDAILLNSIDTFAGTITVPSSGNSTNPITVSAYGVITSNPVISGFTTITGWTNEGGGIYSKVLSGESNPEIVTVNNVQKEMGRTPNSNRYNRQSSDFFHIDSYTGTTQITDTEIPAATANWTGAEAIVRSPSHMYFGRFPITGHTGNVITFTNANNYTLGNGFGYFIQNDLRTLDQFAEWYYGGGKFYMYFGGNNPASYTVKVSTKNKLIDVNNRDYITIKNLKLEGANQYAISTTYGGTSNNLTVKNCYFDFNSTGIYGHTSPEMIVKDNAFMRSTLMAFYSNWESDGTYLGYNTVDSTGLVISAGLSTGSGITNYNHGKGLMLTYAKQVRSTKRAIIEFNTILNSGYMGIDFSGDSMIVRNNFVNKFNMIQSDGGGIYYGQQDALNKMYIEDNIVLDGQQQTDKLGYPTGVIGNNTHGIYLDYKSNGGITVKNNTVANIPLSGVYIHMTQNAIVRENTLYNCGMSFKFQELETYNMPIRNNVVKKNIAVNDTTNNYLIWARSLNNDFNQFGALDSNRYSADINHSTPVGTAVASWTFDYRSFAGWKTYSSQDSHSWFTTNTGKSTIFDYNNTSTAKTVAVTGRYMTADSVVYNNASYTLQPWKSIVLMKDTVSAINIDSIYAAYPLNGNLQDSVASQDGTNSGAVVTTSGKFKAAYDFDTNTDNIYFPINTATLTNASYSVSMWIKFDVLPSVAGVQYNFFSDIKIGPSFKIDAYVSTTNRITVVTRNAALSSFTTNTGASTIASTGVWYHVVINIPKVGQSCDIYVNGFAASTGTLDQTITGTDRVSDYRFYLGAYTGSTALNGQIDDFVIRNCWTSVEEAAHIFNSEMGRYYPFIGQ